MNKFISTKDVARLVREQLKRELPEWKFSVTYKGYSMGSSIDLRLMAGTEEVIASVDCYNARQGYAQLNQYTFGEYAVRNGTWNNGVHLTQRGWDVMATANRIISDYHWDESEPQTDYFCCNFYYHLCIGAWNRDYQVLAATQKRVAK